MFSARCHEKTNIKKTRNGSQEGVESCWTPSPPVLLWFGYHTDSAALPGGVQALGALWFSSRVPPGAEGTCKEGAHCSPWHSSLSLCEASNTKGANPNKSIVEHMPRSIFGESLDIKSPELFGCLLAKRRRDGAGGDAKPQGLQSLGCKCSEPQPMGGMWEPLLPSLASSSSLSSKSCLCSSAWQGVCGKQHNPQKGRVLIK